MRADERSRPRVLVTGFGSFPGVHDNPSARLVGWLERDGCRALGRRLDFATTVLPVTWAALPDIVSGWMREAAPDIVVHFGFSARARGLTIEDRARNSTSPLADVDGAEHMKPEILPGAARQLRAPGAASRLAAHLVRQGLPASTSSDAGRYLCNMLFYLSLDWRRRTGRPKLVNFIHIPPLADAAGRSAPNALGRDALCAGARAVIGYNLARLAKVDRPDVNRPME